MSSPEQRLQELGIKLPKLPSQDGMGSLPGGITVEIEAIVAVRAG